MAEKSRTQWLIDKILASPKLTASDNFATKIYRDEPIVMTGRSFENTASPKIRAMRKLDPGNWSNERLFYEQGKFMAAFADAFPYPGEFKQYYPTYQAMSDAQLRGYFTWRTQVRKGLVEKTSLSFAFVYIYELLNQIGVASPEEGYQALKEFWTAYRLLDERITPYVEMWLKDYVIYYNLDRSLLEGLPDINLDQAVLTLLDYRSHSAFEVFAALDALSSYHMRSSRFFGQYPGDVCEAVYRVFAAISEYYNRLPDKNARDRLFGRITQAPYHLFKSAVFYRRPEPGERVYEVGAYHKYFYRNGAWSCERFVWYGNDNKQIGAILKSIDFLMRQRFDFKSSLQDGKTNKTLKAKIAKEVDAYLADKRRNEPVRVDIDVSKLQGIRETARSTQEKLLLEEDMKQDSPENNVPTAAVEESPAAADNPPGGLNETENRFVQCLLRGEPYSGLLKEKGFLISVLVEGINEKLFPRFNDTVIVYADDKPEVLEEYLADLIELTRTVPT